jgi:nanoRNase/pAp phosphatase (c-di-AMP/oligoRNAs hydrolase)
MTAFVESLVATVADSAGAMQRHAKGRNRARKLLAAMAGKKNILVTTHQYPDPDALASAMGLKTLLETQLKDAKVSMSVKGQIASGINEVFVRHSNLHLVPWDEAGLAAYDGIVLVDTQPAFAYSPLPSTIAPTAVIDHHRSRGRRPKCPFCDIRVEVGASSTIVFSYFKELEMAIPKDLAATLLYGIESDLAGAAGTPGELDNIALSNLTLVADPRKLYQMRYTDLPQTYYIAYAAGLAHATYFDHALITHLGHIDSLEKPAVIADFLLRFDKVDWALVTAVADGKLLISVRTSSTKLSAAVMARRLVRKIGEGGGHKNKAGAYIILQTGTPHELEKLRAILRRRFLRALRIPLSRGQKLVPAIDPR